MSFDYAHSMNNISSFVKNINDNNGQSHVMGRNSNNENILVRFINAITMNVCDKQKLEQLFTELHVLIKVDYGISITTMNIFEKYVLEDISIQRILLVHRRIVRARRI